MEFVDAVLSWTTDGDTVRLPSTLIQPITPASGCSTPVPPGVLHPLPAPISPRSSERHSSRSGLGMWLRS